MAGNSGEKKKDDYQTKELLLKAGRKEFLEKGFEKASLRKICDNAGVTTGAVYFFFENKEDLFHQIVVKAVEEMKILGETLVNEELEGISSSGEGDKKLMAFLWNHREEMQLLLEKSKGTRYEKLKDEIFSQMERNFTMFFQKYGNIEADKELIAILVKMRLKGYMELLKGGYPMEKMVQLSQLIGCYADGGFDSLMTELKKNQKNNKEM